MKPPDMIYVPVATVLHRAAETCTISTSALNTIMQYADSYLMKLGAIKSKLRMSELTDIVAFATGLVRDSKLSSEDSAEIVKSWIESRAVSDANRVALVSRLTEIALGSVRVLFANTSVLDAIKEKIEPTKGEN